MNEAIIYEDMLIVDKRKEKEGKCIHMIINWAHLYKKYKGLWVALKDDEKTVISYGKTIKDVMEKAKKKGATLPILFRVPTRATAYIGIVFHEISL